LNTHQWQGSKHNYWSKRKHAHVTHDNQTVANSSM
jgi:hypothetical protein